MIGVAVAVCALAVAGTLAARRRGSRRGVAWTKPVASAAFVAVGLLAGALASPGGRWLLAALLLSWVGDVALIGRGRTAFALGLGSFLAAHLAFTVSFLTRPLAAGGVAAGGAAMALLALGLARWLAPHLPAAMRLPVAAYVVAIGAMVATATGAALAGAGPGPAIGAALFAASDLFVVRDRFVAPGWRNALWGLPLYYAGQLLLAATAP